MEISKRILKRQMWSLQGKSGLRRLRGGVMGLEGIEALEKDRVLLGREYIWKDQGLSGIFHCNQACPVRNGFLVYIYLCKWMASADA